MGVITDLFCCAIVGFFCVFVANFIFKIPISGNSGRIIFFVGFIGFMIVNYFMTHTESASGIFYFIFGFLVVVGIGYFIILPAIAEEKTTETNGITNSASSGIKESTTAKAVTTTTTAIEYYTRSYQWTYGRHNTRYTIKIPKPLYEYYEAQPHDRNNYAKYALTDKDRRVLDSIISDFKENTDSKTEAAYNIVAFVQSLPYFKDDISTGYDNYPRYPIETLVDNGGDCEDTAILTAAFLKEMNYDVVLINPPGHMAIGITCSGCSGTYYNYNGKKYYYLETTGNNWKVGQMPPKYKGEKVKVFPM